MENNPGQRKPGYIILDVRGCQLLRPRAQGKMLLIKEGLASKLARGLLKDAGCQKLDHGIEVTNGR
jgi:hypothetical protein